MGEKLNLTLTERTAGALLAQLEAARWGDGFGTGKRETDEVRAFRLRLDRELKAFRAVRRATPAPSPESCRWRGWDEVARAHNGQRGRGDHARYRAGASGPCGRRQGAERRQELCL